MEETVVAGMGQATLGDPEMGAPRDSSTFLRDAGAVVTTGPLLVTSWQGRAWSLSRPESHAMGRPGAGNLDSGIRLGQGVCP